MGKKADLTTKKRFIEKPIKRIFGWSPYVQEILDIKFPRDAVKVFVKEKIIRGRKLCIFGRFILNHKIEVVDQKEFIRE